MSVRTVALGIWLCLLLGVAVYAAVAYLAPVERAALPADVLSRVLYVVSGIAAVSALLIHRRLTAPHLVEKYGRAPALRLGVPLDSDAGRALVRRHSDLYVFKVSLISWTLAESIALLGLLLALLSARPLAMAPFAIATVLVLAALKPEFSVVDRMIPGARAHR